MDYIIKLNIPLTLLFSSLGLLISIASFGISYFTFRRDRASIKVKISNGALIFGSNLGDNLQIFLEAINHGRRPVTLSGAGFELNNKAQIAITKPEPSSLPFTVEEGKSCLLYINKDEIINNLKKKKLTIKYGWFRDATGKVYKQKFKYN